MKTSQHPSYSFRLLGVQSAALPVEMPGLYKGDIRSLWDSYSAIPLRLSPVINHTSPRYMEIPSPDDGLGNMLPLR